MKNKIIKWIKKLRGKFPKKYSDCDISSSCSFALPDNISLGRWIFIGPKCFIDAKGMVEIQDGVILSSRVIILTSNHDYTNEFSIPYGGGDIEKPVCLERGVWIGFGAIILPGVTIGEGAIVGAGAVVTKNVEKGKIVGGNPAKEIGNREGNKWIELINQEQYRIKLKLENRT